MTRREVKSRASVLIGYIPISKLECFSEAARSLAAYQLFHHCMSTILDPIIAAGRDGVEMTCADSGIRRVFPILAAYIADHPEQCLITGVKENTCPCGKIDPKHRGDLEGCFLRSVDETLRLLERHRNGEDVPEFKAQGLRPIYEPFWKHLPHCDIFSCITPDILHQLHKGVFKDHLVTWCTKIIGANEMDRRFKAIPQCAGLRYFKKGRSHVSQWTGAEHKEMQKVFVCLMAGAVDSKVLVVVQALVDFIYYAQFQLHTTQTLSALRTSLETFHKHKAVFERLGIRSHFNIPKIHSMIHYIDAIKQKGTTDGFNTELAERLHIDFAKEAYRAGNHRDYIAQMTVWLRRREAVEMRNVYLGWIEKAWREPGGGIGDGEDVESNKVSGNSNEDHKPEETTTLTEETASSSLVFKWAKKPPIPRKWVDEIITSHCAQAFLPAFNRFISEHLPHISPEQDPRRISLELYTQIKVRGNPNVFVARSTDFQCIQAIPEVPPRGRMRLRPAQFDCTLIIKNPSEFALRKDRSLAGTFRYQ